MTTSNSYIETAHHIEMQRLQRESRRTVRHAFLYAKDYVQADVVYQKAFYSHAFSPEGWVAWGDVNYLNNDRRRATEIWEQALEQKHPSEQLYSRLADIYQSNGEFSKAAEYLQKYVAIHSEDASAHYRLGLLLTLSGPDKAISELLNASQLDPELDPAVQTLRTH
jgi:tetratricopeptide (TPR) repeat protein